jgi:hypothetical protein
MPLIMPRGLVVNQIGTALTYCFELVRYSLCAGQRAHNQSYTDIFEWQRCCVPVQFFD